MWNLYLCPLVLSLVMKIMWFGFRLEFGTTERKKNLNEWKQHEAAAKGWSETLSAFVISDKTTHIVSGSASKSQRLYEKMINAYLLKHDLTLKSWFKTNCECLRLI